MKKRNNIIIHFCFFLTLISSILSLNGCDKKQQEQSPQKSFLEFTNEIFREQVTSDTISLHYVLADPKNFGIGDITPSLGEFSAKQMQENASICKEYLTTLKSYDYEQLTKEEQLIYDCLKSSLELDSSMADDIYLQEALGPTSGLQAQLPILFAEYAFNSKKDIEDYILLLYDLGRYYSEVEEFEREKSKRGYFMSDETADAIIKQCQSFIENPEQNFLIQCFSEKLNDVKELSKDDKILLEEKNRDAVLESVIPAYQSLIDTLTALKGTGKSTRGLCGYDGGKKYYEKMAQSNTGSSKSVKEMKQALNNEYKACMTTMAMLQQKNPNILDEFDSIQYPVNEPKEIIEYLKKAIQNDFPLLEEVSYSIKYFHESLQDHLNPAMYLIPPIDDANQNNIYINPKSQNQNEQLFSTLAHEGYPGHLYQNVYLRKINPAPIRRLLSPTGYEEGWATYVEAYSYELAGLEESMATLLSANTIAFQCLYSLTDIGINYDGWDLNDTLSFWMPLGIDRETVEEIYLSMASEPCVYLPYAIGCLEFLELRESAEDELGDKFSLKEFHTFLMNLGPAPFDIIEEHMEQWIDTIK